MDQQLLEQELARYEGRRNEVYLDSRGLKTGGIGHLLEGTDWNVGDAISDEQIDAWFAADIAGAVALAPRIVSCYPTLDDCRQRIIVNLCFNMGNKLAQFVRFIAYTNAGQYDNAASQLEDSAWFTQVGTRGVEMVAAMRTGAYAFES